MLGSIKGCTRTKDLGNIDAIQKWFNLPLHKCYEWKLLPKSWNPGKMYLKTNPKIGPTGTCPESKNRIHPICVLFVFISVFFCAGKLRFLDSGVPFVFLLFFSFWSCFFCFFFLFFLFGPILDLFFWFVFLFSNFSSNKGRYGRVRVHNTNVEQQGTSRI